MLRTTGRGYQICYTCLTQQLHRSSQSLTSTNWKSDRCFSYSSTESALAAPEPEGYGTGKSARLQVDLDETADNFLKENDLKPKNHPGAFGLKKQTLPEKLVRAAERILSHENMSSLEERSKTLKNYLWSRHLPIEEHDYREKVSSVEERIFMKDDALKPYLKEEQQLKLEQDRDKKIQHRLKRLIYHWEPIDYSQASALEYLLSRSAGDFAVLVKLFSEIKTRDPEFKPKTLCDFGSGVGTATWASRSVWPKTLGEFLCVDVSRDMNDLADTLLRGGNSSNDHGIPGLFFRQFLPQSSKISYDLVVSAFSLMELPSLQARLETLNILWKKAKNYIIIVEVGTNAGFKVIIEARDFLLQLDKSKRKQDGHIFSPCPNDTLCPRFMTAEIPCNFSTKYRPLYPFNQDITMKSTFSYVVIKKGPRRTDDDQWPRLVKDPILRKKHVICRVCTKAGNLAEILLTKTQHSETLYRVGRKSSCGDLLPVKETFVTKS